jgi:hypothetical protein
MSKTLQIEKSRESFELSEQCMDRREEKIIEKRTEKRKGIVWRFVQF